MLVLMEGFMKSCGLLSVQGDIDGTHFSILKPRRVFLQDYYYHKIGYNIMA